MKASYRELERWRIISNQCGLAAVGCTCFDAGEVKHQTPGRRVRNHRTGSSPHSRLHPTEGCERGLEVKPEERHGSGLLQLRLISNSREQSLRVLEEVNTMSFKAFALWLRHCANQFTTEPELFTWKISFIHAGEFLKGSTLVEAICVVACDERASESYHNALRCHLEQAARVTSCDIGEFSNAFK